MFPREREKKTLKELAENDQVVFRFVDDHGRPGSYPWNPSGTTDGIAALCNRDGNVFGVQPHPERCFFRHLHPDWTRETNGGDPIYGDGKSLFESVLGHVERRF